MDAADRLCTLVRKTSSTLSPDVLGAIERAAGNEKAGSPAKAVLETICANARLAAKSGTPMCQDTGTLSFFVDERLRRIATPDAIRRAVKRATERGWLRRNTIDSVSGGSVDSNVCDGAPAIHYVIPEDPESAPRVTLLMKGGGSENMSRQYSLPDASLGAGRDLEGVRRCVIDAAQKAQGYGCAPGVLGVCIGGDRAAGYECAKRQLLRKIGKRSSVPELAALEERLADEINSLGIGPMGLGGNTTVLDVKIGTMPRVPASFFVTVAYMCWAVRRRSIAFRLRGGKR